LYLADELPYDIWSFGCILIDLFAQKEQVFKLKINEEELRKMHEIEAFPIVSDEISGFLREIVIKCLERDPEKRIKIDELQESIDIFLKSITDDIKEDENKDNYPASNEKYFNKF
jgi:serine/threonine protein kinase